MKKYVSLFIFLMAPLALLAQNKIWGIGRFKIGQMTIDSLADIPTKKINNKLEMVGVGQKLVELTPNLNNPAQSIGRASNSPDLRIFFSDQYTESGMALKNFYLLFYNELLYKIECLYTDELKQALYLNYGPPTVTQKKVSNNCADRMTGGRGSDQFNESSLAIWSNLPIKAIYYTYQGYDSHCATSRYEFFLIEDTAKTKEILAKGRAAQKDFLRKK